jgi:alanine racemase
VRPCLLIRKSHPQSCSEQGKGWQPWNYSVTTGLWLVAAAGLYDRNWVPATFTSSRIETRPNWAEVSLPALRHNFRALQRHVGSDVAICAVVKCDAYGHGAQECALALEHQGAQWFGVTSTDEGAVLREAGVTGRILVMCGVYRGEEEDALRLSLTPAVFRLEDAEALVRAATRRRLTSRIAIHLKIDTGMARLGLPLAELESFAQGVQRLPQIELEGVFSHLASSEVLDDEATQWQIERFTAALSTLGTYGLRPRLRHLANTSAAIERPDTWHNFVRPGLALYGYEQPPCHHDGSPVTASPLPLRPVLAWKTHVIAVRDVPAGQGLGYNGAYKTPVPARIATISVGYGDGLSRRLFGNGEVLLRGQRAPMRGRISMDLTLVDVTHIPGAAIGDEVTLIGGSGEQQITARDLARWEGTVVYETLCNLTKRVPRRYVE